VPKGLRVRVSRGVPNRAHLSQRSESDRNYGGAIVSTDAVDKDNTSRG